jgi:hypothetical protein
MSWLHPLLHHIAVQTRLSGANLPRKILSEIFLHGVSRDVMTFPRSASKATVRKIKPGTKPEDMACFPNLTVVSFSVQLSWPA